MKLARILAAMAAVVACSGVRADNTRHDIVPGERIGVIKLGMHVTQVHDEMTKWGAEPLLKGSSGGPGAWIDKQAGCAIEAYQTDSVGKGRYANVMKVFYVKDKVAQIAVQSMLYVTNRGATIRITSAEFRNRHPSLTQLSVTESWGGRVRPYDSSVQGLAVTYPVIQHNTEVRTAQEIFVHERGARILLESPRHEGNVAKPALMPDKKASGPSAD